MRAAASARAPLRIVGSGTWLDAGRPVDAAERLPMRELSGIVEYVPGDLTLTARAGTTLAEIRHATARNGQWLALDPHGSDDGTIGATVATASAGPLATAFGTPRDLVLGLEFVTGSGSVARGGGRVVKNVAGFDLTRLMTGSWGTLGAITEVSVRLHARPATDETVVVALDDGDAGVARVRRVLRHLPFTPYACEIVNDNLAKVLGLPAATAMLVRMGGNSEAVAAQQKALSEIGGMQPADPRLWTVLRASEPADAAVVRHSTAPARIDTAWSEAMRWAAASPGTLVHAAPARGVVRCIMPAAANITLPAANPAVKRIAERLAATQWNEFASPAGERLSRGIKTAFDPSRVLNPGIFGEPV
jgi:glycolate oxidase FAD binding subunit